MRTLTNQSGKIAKGLRSLIPLLALTVVVAVLSIFGGVSEAGAAVPVKLTLTSQFGSEVNGTEAGKGAELEDVCTVASKDKCQPGAASSAPGGFQFAEGVAAAPSGDVYVVDAGNARIQELTATGRFVLMFGKEVNETTGGDVCTATEIAKSAVKCKAGVEGSAPGQLDHPYSIAVDPSGDVYVAELVEAPGAFGERVQKFTPEGSFVLELGKEVNETKRDNLCTHEEEEKEIVKCTGPAVLEYGAPYTPEDGSFNFESGVGDLLAVGHEGKLYVGDEGRVQEFKENGEFSEEVPLEAGTRVDALTLDAAGDLYLTDDTSGSLGNVVREFGTKGEEIKHFPVSPEEPGAKVTIHGLALDAEGHLAVAAVQQLTVSSIPFGSLYEASTAQRLTAFKIPEGSGVKGITFDLSGDLYAAAESSHEILAYLAKFVAGVATGPAPCAPGPGHETDVTLNCTLEGEVNPEGVSETEARFEWGRGSATTCGLGALTPKQSLATVNEALTVSAALEGLRPNESYCYRLVAEDSNAKSPEPLEAELASLTTQMAAPRILGEPEAQFVKASSVVMFDELNPENADTKYYFEYWPTSNSADKMRTATGQSGVYGSIGATSEAVGLRPGTEYSYRLFAENENTLQTERRATTSEEGSFTTARVPSPSAETGSHSAPGATSAVVYATVTPDGAPVTYSFELGVYEGAATQYGVVSSGSVEPNGGPVVESLVLTGLQPRTTYAYRIAISSGYIDNEAHMLQGQAATFITNGLPVVLQPPLVLAQLPVPHTAFPTVPQGSTTTAKAKTCKKGHVRKGNKCVAKKKKSKPNKKPHHHK